LLDVHFVILGAAIGSVGMVAYVRDTIRGETQPNRVTWLMWAVAPLLAFAVEVNEGVGLRSLMTFVVGFFPLLIFIASFLNARSVWQIGRLDYACGVLSAAGLAAWLVTRHGTVALWASIGADALAAVPTILKSWRFPETETAAAYAAAGLNAAITLLTVKHVTTAVVAFPAYIVVVAFMETAIIAGRIGPRIRSRSSAASASSPA
jgi:hypothetical protein